MFKSSFEMKTSICLIQTTSILSCYSVIKICTKLSLPLVHNGGCPAGCGKGQICTGLRRIHFGCSQYLPGYCQLTSGHSQHHAAQWLITGHLHEFYRLLLPVYNCLDIPASGTSTEGHSGQTKFPCIHGLFIAILTNIRK